MSGDTWGGLEVVVLNLLRAQATRLDVKPSLVVLNEGRFEKTARELGIQVRVVPEAGTYILRLVRAVGRAFAELTPDIIHAHRYKEQFLSYVLARKYGARCVATIHGYEPPTTLSGRLKFAVWDSMNRALARLVGTRFVAVSDDLRRRYKVSANRSTIIPNGIMVQNFKARLGVLPERGTQSLPVIGWTGRMVPVKGLEILLKAVAHMAVNLPVRVLLIGDGPERANLEKLARSLGITDSVRFAGFVPEPLTLLDTMDVFALPSLHEGIPMSLLEALAAGVPVVAAAVGGIPGMIGDSGAAQLVHSSSPEAWAAALTSVITNPEQSRVMAKRGRRLVEEQFSMDAMVNRYCAVYAEMLS